MSKRIGRRKYLKRCAGYTAAPVLLAAEFDGKAQAGNLSDAGLTGII